MTQYTARIEPRPALIAYGDAVAARAQRPAERRAPSQPTQAKSRRRRKKRRVRATLARRIGKLACVLFGAVFAWAAAIGADSALAPGVPTIGISGEAAAAVSASMIAWAVDVNDDGVADLANPTNGALRTIDLWGSGEYGAPRSTGRRKRVHAGADYIAYPGQVVRSPIAGEVTRIGFAYSNDRTLRFVEITNPETQQTARVLYVKPSVHKGQVIAATDPIGGAQSLAMRYPGITNHVHVELLDARGRRQDPSLVLPDTPRFVVARRAPPAEPSPT